MEEGEGKERTEGHEEAAREIDLLSEGRGSLLAFDPGKLVEKSNGRRYSRLERQRPLLYPGCRKFEFPQSHHKAVHAALWFVV